MSACTGDGGVPAMRERISSSSSSSTVASRFPVYQAASVRIRLIGSALLIARRPETLAGLD
jgi:hypothetical protein